MARKALIKDSPTPIPKEPAEKTEAAEDPQPAEEIEAIAEPEPNAIRWTLAQPAGYPAGLISPTDIALRPGDIVGLGKPIGNESRFIFAGKGSALVRSGFAAFLYVATSDNSKEG